MEGSIFNDVSSFPNIQRSRIASGDQNVFVLNRFTTECIVEVGLSHMIGPKIENVSTCAAYRVQIRHPVMHSTVSVEILCVPYTPWGNSEV